MIQDQKQLAVINTYKKKRIISRIDMKIKEEWREDCKTIALAAINKLPDGRERAIVLTKIEEALLWGHRSIDTIPNQSQE